MKKLLILFAALACLAALAGGAQAAKLELDLWTAFPDFQGQNGFYAYACQAGREVPYRQLTRSGSHYFNTPLQDWFIPFLQQTTSPWVTMAPSAVSQCGKVYGPENAVLAWQVPQTGTYNISGQFNLPVESGGGDVNVYIRRNDTLLWGPKNIFLVGTQDFTLVASLKQNDLLYFGVDAGADDICDTTLLKGQISTVLPAVGPAIYPLLLD